MIMDALAQNLGRPVPEVMALLVKASRMDKYAVVEPPASQDQVEKAEEQAGWQLDPVHRDLLRLMNGGVFRCFAGGQMVWFATHPKPPRRYPGQHNATPRIPGLGESLPEEVPVAGREAYVPFATLGGTYYAYSRTQPGIWAVTEQGEARQVAADFAGFLATLDVRVNMPEYTVAALKKLAAG